MIYSLHVFLLTLAAFLTFTGGIIFFRLASLKITVTNTYVIFSLASFIRLFILLEVYVIHHLLFDLYPILLELAISIFSFWGGWRLWVAVSSLPNVPLKESEQGANVLSKP